MREDKHNVRVTFKHGNGITINGKGCGQIFLKPNHDYFFENAPMQFINYLPQLRRLGVTYKLTNDKRGCYQTFNLANYYTNDPFTLLNRVRSNKASENLNNLKELEKVVMEEDETVSEEEITEEEKVQEVTPSEIPVIGNEEVTNESSDDTQVTPQEETTENKLDEEVDVESLSKPDLISYAHSLGINQVTDYWTKKEIKEIIYKTKSN